jgi:hypothetical protein
MSRGINAASALSAIGQLIRDPWRLPDLVLENMAAAFATLTRDEREEAIQCWAREYNKFVGETLPKIPRGAQEVATAGMVATMRQKMSDAAATRH